MSDDISDNIIINDEMMNGFVTNNIVENIPISSVPEIPNYNEKFKALCWHGFTIVKMFNLYCIKKKTIRLLIHYYINSIWMQLISKIKNDFGTISSNILNVNIEPVTSNYKKFILSWNNFIKKSNDILTKSFICKDLEDKYEKLKWIVGDIIYGLSTEMLMTSNAYFDSVLILRNRISLNMFRIFSAIKIIRSYEETDLVIQCVALNTNSYFYSFISYLIAHEKLIEMNHNHEIFDYTNKYNDITVKLAQYKQILRTYSDILSNKSLYNIFIKLPNIKLDFVDSETVFLYIVNGLVPIDIIKKYFNVSSRKIDLNLVKSTYDQLDDELEKYIAFIVSNKINVSYVQDVVEDIMFVT